MLAEPIPRREPKSPVERQSTDRIGSTSVTFGDRRARGKIFDEKRFRSPVSSSTRLSFRGRGPRDRFRRPARPSGATPWRRIITPGHAGFGQGAQRRPVFVLPLDEEAQCSAVLAGSIGAGRR